MKKLLVFLTACATICAFGSCGEKEESSAGDNSATSESSVVQVETKEYDNSLDKSTFVGKWECTKFIADGEEYSNYQGMPMYAIFQYDFKEDGKVEYAEGLMELMTEENADTWGVVSDSEIEVVVNNSTLDYVLENGQLVHREGGQEIYLDKVDDFQEFDYKSYYEGVNVEYSLVPVETDAAGNVVATGEAITVAGDN